MEAALSSEASMNVYRNAWNHTPEDGAIRTQRYENLKSATVKHVCQFILPEISVHR
jgi:hypothetical protein